MRNKAHTIYRLLASHSQIRMTRRFTACLLVAFGLLLLVGGTKNMGQSEANTQQQFPRGNWSIGMHPYLGSGYDAVPVIVTSVTSDAKRGIAVTKVGLENQSTQNVTAIKLTWRLSTEQNPGNVLLQGQTPFVTRDGGFPAGSNLRLRFPVVAFAKIFRPLVKSDALEGEFRIDILVSEVLYDDGSKWTNDGSKQAKLIKANHASGLMAQGTCPRQACESRTSPSGHVFYACRASTGNELCSVAEDAFSCTNTSCTRPRPSSEYEGYEMIIP